MNKLVGILLVTHNDKNNLPLLFHSLKSQSYQNFRIYLVDNNSSDQSLDHASQLNKDLGLSIKYFPLNKNTGFSGGNNKAANEAVKENCEYLFVLNNDMELDKYCIEELIKLLENDKNIGAAGPILFLWNREKSTNTIQFYGAKINFKKYEVHDSYSNKIFESIKETVPEKIIGNQIPGGATFIRTDLVKQIGLWDERYFMYGDEIDLSRRVLNAGSRMMLTYRAKIWHNHKMLTKNKQLYYLEYYLIARNKYLYYYKYRMYSWIIHGLLYDLMKFPSKLLWFKKVCDWKLGTYYLRGILAGLLNHTGKPNFVPN